MKRIFPLLLFLGLLSSEAFGCPTCMPAKDSQQAAHMAVAIWVMIGAVMHGRWIFAIGCGLEAA